MSEILDQIDKEAYHDSIGHGIIGFEYVRAIIGSQEKRITELEAKLAWSDEKLNGWMDAAGSHAEIIQEMHIKIAELEAIILEIGAELMGPCTRDSLLDLCIKANKPESEES